ncbi:MAG: hypothetical protein ACRD3W_06720, partial [Terriglobales bacterium]
MAHAAPRPEQIQNAESGIKLSDIVGDHLRAGNVPMSQGDNLLVATMRQGSGGDKVLAQFGNLQLTD